MNKNLALCTVAMATLGGCESFWDVVVPAADTTPPTAIATIYENGTHVPASDRTTHDPSEGIVVVASGIDEGGIKRISLTRSGKVYCDIGGGFSKVYHLDTVPTTIEVGGGVGDTVSNGQWTFDVARPGDIGCGPGEVVLLAEYHWGVEAEDFHGNTSSMTAGVLSYEP
jgi:hypothetical protein